MLSLAATDKLPHPVRGSEIGMPISNLGCGWERERESVTSVEKQVALQGPGAGLNV